MSITADQHNDFLKRMHADIEEAGFTLKQVAEHIGATEDRLRTPLMSELNPDGLTIDEVYEVSQLVNNGSMVQWFSSF